jgi:hypothetical protein
VFSARSPLRFPRSVRPFGRTPDWAMVAAGVGFACAGCATSAPTTLYTPVTGITIPASAITAGRGCGPLPEQVFKYAAVVTPRASSGSSGGALDGGTADSAASEAGSQEATAPDDDGTDGDASNEEVDGDVSDGAILAEAAEGGTETDATLDGTTEEDASPDVAQEGGAPNGVSAGGEASEGGAAIIRTSGVFDCFADGFFTNLPITNGTTPAFDIHIFAFNKDSFPPALDCGPDAGTMARPPCPGDDPAAVEPWERAANWTTDCTATEVLGVTAIATCPALTPSVAVPNGDAASGD